MNIWLVSPAWRRYSITRLVLEERRWLCDQLAARGHTANSVIVSDDENLDIADEYGFPTVEQDNSDLGARFNAGYQYAADQGAELFVHIGSDDWVHPDAFNIIDETDLDYGSDMEPGPGGVLVWSPGPVVVAQRRLLIVDLERSVGQRCYITNQYGCIPWLIPRAAMEPTGFQPIKPGLTRGIDGSLAVNLGGGVNWVHQDAPDEWCVDFKTRTNITPYAGLATTLGSEPEDDAWLMLAEFYPDHLIQAAKQTVAA